MLPSLIKAPHRQVDSGLGFECDEDIVRLVRLFNEIPGIQTQFSCQGGEGEDAQVLFTGSLDDLLLFCRRLRPLLSARDYSCGKYPTGEEGFAFDLLKIIFQRDSVFPSGENFGGIRGELTFASSQMERMIRTIRKLRKTGSNRKGTNP